MAGARKTESLSRSLSSHLFLSSHVSLSFLSLCSHVSLLTDLSVSLFHLSPFTSLSLFPMQCVMCMLCVVLCCVVLCCVVLCCVVLCCVVLWCVVLWWWWWLWCGPVCSAHVSVDISAQDAPNYGGRVPVDTTPGPAPVCRALKIYPSFQLLRPTAGTGPQSVAAHNGHATTPAQPTSTTLRNDRDVDNNDGLQLRRLHSLQQS